MSRATRAVRSFLKFAVRLTSVHIVTYVVDRKGLILC
jgi:hypothetical protein